MTGNDECECECECAMKCGGAERNGIQRGEKDGE